MIIDEIVLLCDEIDDFIIFINDLILLEMLVFKDYKVKLFKYNFLNKNRKIILIIGLFILIIIISILVKYIYGYIVDFFKNLKDSLFEDIIK